MAWDVGGISSLQAMACLAALVPPDIY